MRTEAGRALGEKISLKKTEEGLSRCLTYHRLQALMVLVTAAAHFTAEYLGLRMKLRILAGQVLRAAKRVFGIPDFRLHGLADGIRQFLYSQTQRLKKFLELQSPGPIQPKLFDS